MLYEDIWELITIKMHRKFLYVFLLWSTRHRDRLLVQPHIYYTYLVNNDKDIMPCHAHTHLQDLQNVILIARMTLTIE